MRLDWLLQHAADMDVEVEWCPKMRGRRGDYSSEHKRIRLDRTLTRPQLVTTLAHEVGHAVFDDVGTTPAIERRASEMGASLVISPAEYEAAERLVGPHPGALAVELGVTRHLVEAWRRWYAKRWPREQSTAQPEGDLG